MVKIWTTYKLTLYYCNNMKRIIGILAILMVIMGFGMNHGTRGTMEIVSLMLISVGVVILLTLLMSSKKKDTE